MSLDPFKQLKETVEDRVRLLEHVVAAIPAEYGEGTRGRLDEAKVILDLINRVDIEEQECKEHPLLTIESMQDYGEDPFRLDEDLDRHDPRRC